MRDIANEIHVADTASTDGTADVAAAAGASVSQFSWEDDFSAGRNYLVAQATSDWIFWLDAKEQMLPQGAAPLFAAIEQPNVFGLFVNVRQVREADSQPLGDASDLRLFRRRPDVRFIGRLHPHFDPALVAAVGREGFVVGPCDVTLLHYAEEGPPSESKLRWTVRLLELELRDRPGQLHYMIELGRTLQILKDPRAHDAMAAAAEQVSAVRESPQAPAGNVQVLLRYLLTQPPANVRGPLAAADARELAVRWFAASPPILWLMAEQAFAANDFAAAASLLERLVNLGRTGEYDRSQRFDPNIVGELATLNLGICYARLGRNPESEACLVQLIANPTLGARASRELQAIRRPKV